MRKSIFLAILSLTIFAATLIGSWVDVPFASAAPVTALDTASTPPPVIPAKAERSGPALWTIDKAKGHIWFFGSVHVLPKGEQWRTPELTQALEATDAIVLEIPFADAQSMTMQAYLITSGFSLSQQPLSKQGTPDQQAAFAKAAHAAGLEPYQIDQMKPWFAAISLTMGLLVKSGYDPNNGVDQHIDREADQRGKERLYFESAREQLDLFINLPADTQMKMLRDTVSEINDNPKMVDDLVAAWRSADVKNLSKLANDSYTSPELEKVLLTDRNERWVTQIDSWLKDDKNYLIVVGAGHLAGEDSVIAMLRNKGVKVKGP